MHVYSGRIFKFFFKFLVVVNQISMNCVIFSNNYYSVLSFKFRKRKQVMRLNCDICTHKAYRLTEDIYGNRGLDLNVRVLPPMNIVYTVD